MPPAKESHTEEITITERLNDFLQKHRNKLFIGLVTVIVVIAGFVVFTSVRAKLLSEALVKVDEFSHRYETLKIFISGDDEEALSKQSEITALLDDISAFTQKKSGFPAAKAYAISAEINWDKKNWAEAEKDWTVSAEAAAKTYLAPVSMYNAAAAAEEQGNVQTAIDLYTKAINYEGDFPAAARAQFSIGRLEESRNNSTAALEAYRNLVSKWPSDPVWANLAQSRIVVLSD